MKTKIQSRVYRKIFEEYYGVTIPKGYHIHHIDGDRTNNNPKNLKMMSAEEHQKLHLEQNDPVAYRGKFIQGASQAGKKGGKVKSDRKKESSSKNLKEIRRSDLGAKASVEARRKNKTFFFSEEYQKQLHERMKRDKNGPYCEKHRRKMIQMGISKGKKPIFGNKCWNSSYEASIDSGLPASTIRYRCRKNILGWRYKHEESHDTR